MPTNKKKSETIILSKKDYWMIGALTTLAILILISFIQISLVNKKIDSRVGERGEEGALEGKVYFTEKNLFFSGDEASCSEFCQETKCIAPEYDGYDGKHTLNGRDCSCQCYKLVK